MNDLSAHLALLQLRGEDPHPLTFLQLVRGAARADAASLPPAWAALLAHLESPASRQAFAVAFLTRAVRPPARATSLHPICVTAAACVTRSFEAEASTPTTTPVLDAVSQADEFTLEDLRLSAERLGLSPTLAYWSGWLLSGTREAPLDEVSATSPQAAPDADLSSGLSALYERLLLIAPRFAPPRMAGE